MIRAGFASVALALSLAVAACGAAESPAASPGAAAVGATPAAAETGPAVSPAAEPVSTPSPIADRARLPFAIELVGPAGAPATGTVTLRARLRVVGPMPANLGAVVTEVQLPAGAELVAAPPQRATLPTTATPGTTQDLATFEVRVRGPLKEPVRYVVRSQGNTGWGFTAVAVWPPPPPATTPGADKPSAPVDLDGHRTTEVIHVP